MNLDELRSQAAVWEAQTGWKARQVRLTTKEWDVLRASVGMPNADHGETEVFGMRVRVADYMPPAGRFAGTPDTNIARDPLIGWRKVPGSERDIAWVAVGDKRPIAAMVADRGWMAWGPDARIVGGGPEVGRAGREKATARLRKAWEGAA